MQGRGSHDYRTESEQNIIALKWYDNRYVHLVSSHKGKNPVEPVKRWSVAKPQYVDVSRPAIVMEYNNFMGGVDLHGMLIALYRRNIGVEIFYLRIVFHIIDICIVNAWRLYRHHCTQRGFTKHTPLLAFRSDIAHALLKAGHSVVRKRGWPSQDSPSPSAVKKRTPSIPNPVDDVRFDHIGHWPEHLANRVHAVHQGIFKGKVL
ncbi:hypothetical protein PR048_020530 [Dryococelus australis]|uniref:PiggyBac transposable element-derived protein domain-containing protein n=1 Tax=Dryococelus australis TaxID=614101 RepID=A0ABQ9H6P3_9NEOP|nr:hypothetical protein PR048_020530 [Dryococelus australis]